MALFERNKKQSTAVILLLTKSNQQSCRCFRSITYGDSRDGAGEIKAYSGEHAEFHAVSLGTLGHPNVGQPIRLSVHQL